LEKKHKKGTVVEILAGACGLIAGLLGAAPFVFANRLVRKKEKFQDSSMIIVGLGAMMVSFLIIVAAMLACFFIARSLFIPFAGVCFAVFLATMIVYGVRLLSKKPTE
jgi:drug/metabolite transporter (DMT)-like permease